ncbi:MAG: 3-methyl-2-oxobutanoate dehydrogenase subunit VorB [Deltaproteobacteria bacterium]|nr:3-methyl-2-oxobutanoate dehydrogenase subunit VorB [Deltaproteobacteria bacterium]
MARMLMKGNEAIAEAAIAAGCRYFFGYPITPQSEIPEYLSKRLPEVGGVYLQAESEVAAINMVFGAAGAGVRVMTSSSSPGISLKQEGISSIACAETPAVVVNMMRGGPGIGSIQASQNDYFQAVKGGGHGDYHNLVYAPASIQEACDLMAKAFDRADYYRVLCMVLGDGMLGQMMEPVEIKPVKIAEYDKSWATTGWDGVSRPRAVINTLYITVDELNELCGRLQAKYKIIERDEVLFEEFHLDDAEYVVVAYGTVARIVKNAIENLRAQGIKVGLFRPITLWPFPMLPLENIAGQARVKRFAAVEMSAGQLVQDVRLAVNGKKPVELQSFLGSNVPGPGDIAEFIRGLKTA